ncbi:hypothetical protein ACN4EE_00295 [Geminocystis sp. CENA526]|uniref:hypothetical protein n=1 Tax=Geminocystis sp. CENA526 TaxID=1355871 RepID=UPI003D6DC09E
MLWRKSDTEFVTLNKKKSDIESVINLTNDIESVTKINGTKLVQNGYNEEQKEFIADDSNLSSRHLIWHCTQVYTVTCPLLPNLITDKQIKVRSNSTAEDRVLKV